MLQFCNIAPSLPHESDHGTLHLVTLELRFARNICTRIGVCTADDEKMTVHDKALVRAERLWVEDVIRRVFR